MRRVLCQFSTSVVSLSRIHRGSFHTSSNDRHPLFDYLRQVDILRIYSLAQD
jgi:hypothetical protein